MRRVLLAALAALSLAAASSLPAQAALTSSTTKVAIIVGPVGKLTPTYLHLAELAAAEAERQGATVARAYSPNASPANVLAAVEDAHVVIYFGHGYGHPSPYGGLDTARQNGWGLQGPGANGTHGDALDGEMEYFGEDWIVANARPAPGFVMIYSNVCYAPGASEGGFPAATEKMALERVAYYSRKVFAMGGSAYYAIDFDRGAAGLVRRILGDRQATYGAAFAGDERFVPGALRTYQHPFSIGQQVWLHRTKYTDGPPNYWYAFAGNPESVPDRSWDPVAPTAQLTSPTSELGPDATFAVRVSEPVVGLDGTSWRLTDADGGAVPATVTFDAETGTASFVPAQALRLSEQYRLHLGPGVTDVAGNPMEATEWVVSTRLDADPLARDLPIVVAPGTHELVRVDATGLVIERRPVEVGEERGLAAARRARLPGQPGSWFEIRAGEFAGWWVAESPVARASGVLGVETFTEPIEVEFPAGRYELRSVDDGVASSAGELVAREGRTVTVDARAVAEGQLIARVAAGSRALAGHWIPVAAGQIADDVGTQRVTGRAEREVAASVRIGPGEWPAFSFDGTGRVLERRVIGGDGTTFFTTRSLAVGGADFHVIDGGELDGWALAADPAHTVVPGKVEGASAE